MIWHVLEAVAGAVAVFGLGWAAGLRWERAGREVERLLDEAQGFYEEDEEPARVFGSFDAAEKGQTGPPDEPPAAARVVVVATRHPVLWGEPAGTPIFDRLVAEFERRVHPADEALAAALNAGAEFTASLDLWADGARAIVRGAG